MGDMNCGWIQTVLAVIILVFVLWPNLLGAAIGAYSTWIVVVSAVLLLIHALICKKCQGVCSSWMSKPKAGKRKR